MSPRYVNDSIHSISQKFCREFEQSAVRKVVKNSVVEWYEIHPLPRGGKGRWKFPEITRNENIIKIKLLFYVRLLAFLYNIPLLVLCVCLIVIFLIRIPEDILNQEFLQTRALCKFSTEILGCCMNRIIHTSVMYVSEFTTLSQMWIVNARLIFYEWLNYKKFSLAISPHHLAKCVICIFAKFVWFSPFWWNHENMKNEFFTHLQNSEK